MGSVKDVEIFTGDLDVPYTKVRLLEAKVEAGSAFLPAPTIEAANFKLIELAVSVGANAVINVKYDALANS